MISWTIVLPIAFNELNAKPNFCSSVPNRTSGATNSPATSFSSAVIDATCLSKSALSSAFLSANTLS